MKRPLVVTLILIAFFTVIGWRQETELQTLRSKAESGETASMAGSMKVRSSQREAKRTRPDTEAEARRVAAEFIAYAVEMDASGHGATWDPKVELRRRIASQVDAVISLNSRQLTVLVEEIAEVPGLEDRLRNHLLGWVLQRLGKSRPDLVLSLLTPELREVLGRTGGSLSQVLNSALQGLAKDDPDAALRWYLEQDALPEEFRRSCEQSLVAGAAEEDFPRALLLMDEFGFDRDIYLPWLVSRKRQTPEQQQASLDALRAWKRNDPGRHDKEFHRIVGQLLLGDPHSVSRHFPEVVNLVRELKLPAAEMAVLVRADVDLGSRIKLEEAPMWAVWLVEQIPGEQSLDKARLLFRKWAWDNPEGANAWLHAAAPGPAKTAGILGFSDAMGNHQPAAARRWLETLPPGPEREEAMERLPEDSSRGDQ